MNTVITNEVAEFTAPVPVVDYIQAAIPTGELALRIAAESINKATGKGLLRDLSIGRGADVMMINPYSISVKDGWNCRNMADPENVLHIETLAQQIVAAGGVQVALKVMIENDKVFIVDGHCRWLAVRHAIEVHGAEIKAIPVQQVSRFHTEADRVISQITFNGGKPLTPFETGKNFVRMIGFGWTEKQIAERAGVSVVRVNQILDLMAGSDGIKELVANGSVSATQAAQTLREVGGDAVAAEAALTGAVKIAKAAGKKRATAKHVKAATGKAVKSPKALLAETKVLLAEIKALRAQVAATQAAIEAKTTEITTSGKWTTVTMLTTDYAKAFIA